MKVITTIKEMQAEIIQQESRQNKLGLYRQWNFQNDVDKTVVYTLALHGFETIPYFQNIVFTHKKKTPIVEVVDLVLFP